MIIGDYTIVFEENRRYYIEDLSNRDYSLECATPHLLRINDYEIQENTWVEIIRSLAAYLISITSKSNDDVLSFKTEWTKTKIFSPIQKTNYKQIDENLYVNCNHTAVHSCWLIQDLLDFFDIDKSNVYFLIHRTPYAEPKEAKLYFKEKFKKEFSLFLQIQYSKSDKNIQTIISNIENYMDPILATFTKSYNSFLLFDDGTTLSNYISKFKEVLNENTTYPYKMKKAMERYLGYLSEYYKI